MSSWDNKAVLLHQNVKRGGVTALLAKKVKNSYGLEATARFGWKPRGLEGFVLRCGNSPRDKSGTWLPRLP